MSKTIVVLGSTGNQGSSLVKALSGTNQFNVLAVTRDTDSEKAKALGALPGVKLITGAPDTPDAFFKHGSVHGLFLMQHSDADGELEQGRTIIDLCVKQGVEHIVYTGVDLSGLDDTTIPSFETKRQLADYLKAQPIRYTIINPTMFMDNFWSPPMIDCVTTVWGPKKRKLIATSDIGMVSAAAFIHPEDWVGKELDLAADDLSPKEIVEAFNDIKNRDITAEKAPQLPPHLLHMLKVQDGHEFAADVADCRRLFPGLKDLRTWLATEYFG